MIVLSVTIAFLVTHIIAFFITHVKIKSAYVIMKIWQKSRIFADRERFIVYNIIRNQWIAVCVKTPLYLADFRLSSKNAEGIFE